MADVRDEPGVPLRLHNLLLSMAGRIDDAALSEAREHLATSHIDEAVELVVGTLVAGGIPVRSKERLDLVSVLELSRSDPALADSLVVEEPGRALGHRFSVEKEPARGIAEALERAFRVLPDLRSVRAVWRNTPAGSAPGPLPQRIVLIEIGPHGHAPAVAYRIDKALRRAGIRSTVEVAGPDAPWCEYHDAALNLATDVWLASEQSDTTGTDEASSVSDTSQGSADEDQTGRSRSSDFAPTEPAKADSHPQMLPAGISDSTQVGDVESDPVEADDAIDSDEPTQVETSLENETDNAVGADAETEGANIASDDAVQARETTGTEATEGASEPKSPAESATSMWASARPDARHRTEPEPPPVPAAKPPWDSVRPGQYEKESRAEHTAEMSSAEVAQLRKALAEEPERGKAVASSMADQPEVVDLPALDLDDPNLSERDRRLLRELHAELAERDRGDNPQVRMNGTPHGPANGGGWSR